MHTVLVWAGLIFCSRLEKGRGLGWNPQGTPKRNREATEGDLRGGASDTPAMPRAEPPMTQNNIEFSK